MRTKMQRWAIAGAFAAIVSCGGESVIGGGEDAGGTGGTAGISGSSGVTGGTGATFGGTGGTTGAAGSGGGSTSPGGTLPFESAECDFPAVLSSNCAISGCHKPGAIALAAGLSLVPDSGFVSRVKDVPATHSDIYCGNVPCPTIPPECPTGAKRVDSANWQESWIYRKINDAMGCGVEMPPSVTFDAADRACIVLLVKTIAELP
jgi:hypothetical protein